VRPKKKVKKLFTAQQKKITITVSQEIIFVSAGTS
jgi:hypothetical protein